VLAACTSPQDATTLTPPDLLEQLSNADLKPPPSSDSKTSQVEYASGPWAGNVAQTYPGDDSALAARKKRDIPSQGIARGTNGYELNFADAELSELAKVILRDTLGQAYIFDPRVQGRVTISTGGPVSREEILSILESVLAMHRGALITEGNLYKIVPEAEARQKVSIAVDYNSERKEVGVGYGISILPLKHISADTMTRMLSSLASQDPPRASLYNNLLIVRGTAQHRESVIDLAVMFDVDWMKGQSAGIFTLKNATPEDVIKELHAVFQEENQGKGLVRFQSISRLNAILAVTTKTKMLDEVETWIGRLDRGGSEGENYYVYRVENGRAKDLAELLMAAFNGGGGTIRGAEESEVSPTESATRTTTTSMSGTTATGTGVEGDTATPTAATDSSQDSSSTHSAASSASSPAFGSASSASSDQQVRIVPDERNNKLLIKATGRDLRRILSILRRIDQPPLQVLINATLAEVTLTDQLQYGVQYFLQKSGRVGGLLGFSNGSDIEIAPPVPGLNFIVGSLVQPKFILDLLSRETAVRVVSSPSVVVLHNQPATLQVGDEIPVTTRTATNISTDNPTTVNEVQYKNTGVILKVTPRINSNGLVTMDIEQEISSVPRTTTETLTPTISQRRISSTIAVESGQLVILGGLISEQSDHSKDSIPLLGKIPYVGDVLGGSTGRSKERKELVVFLQPSVIRDPHDAARVAEEVRAGMQSLAPRPAAWDVDVRATGPSSRVK
jgi:general secretion pathway protein D